MMMESLCGPKIFKYTRAYLAGNFEYTDGVGWRDELAKELSEKFGIISLDPTKQMFRGHAAETQQDKERWMRLRKEGKFNLLHGETKGIVRRDLRAIDIADMVICRLEIDKPTFGTITELTVAANQRKPILTIVKDVHLMPIWLTGLLNMEFAFRSKDDLISYFHQVECGMTGLDSKYWKILTPELLKIN